MLPVLVLGMCFFAGGLKYSEQGFGISALIVLVIISALLIVFRRCHTTQFVVVDN